MPQPSRLGYFGPPFEFGRSDDKRVTSLKKTTRTGSLRLDHPHPADHPDHLLQSDGQLGLHHHNGEDGLEMFQMENIFGSEFEHKLFFFFFFLGGGIV